MPSLTKLQKLKQRRSQKKRTQKIIKKRKSPGSGVKKKKKKKMSGSQSLKKVLTDILKNHTTPSNINKITKEYKDLKGLAEFLINDHYGNFQRKWDIRGVFLLRLKKALENALKINVAGVYAGGV